MHTPIDLRVLRSQLEERLESFALNPTDTVEERCRSYLEGLRWPNGVECPRCQEATRLGWLETRRKWHCYGCRYQFSVTAGTSLHNSHLPVWKWFVSVEIMLNDGLTANQLHQIIGGSSKTAWFAAHKIRAAMPRRAGATVESGPGRFSELDYPGTALDPGVSPRARRHDPFRRMRSIVQARHRHVSAKYLDAYTNEHLWRSANHGNPHAFRDTILALIHGKGLTYHQLTAVT